MLILNRWFMINLENLLNLTIMSNVLCINPIRDLLKYVVFVWGEKWLLDASIVRKVCVGNVEKFILK